MKKNNFAKIEQIINVAKKGGMFILVDDEKRENEGEHQYEEAVNMEAVEDGVEIE